MAEQKSGKCKKSGRNAAKCKRYADTKQREKNKLRTLRKQIIRHPGDRKAVDAFLKVVHKNPSLMNLRRSLAERLRELKHPAFDIVAV